MSISSDSCHYDCPAPPSPTSAPPHPSHPRYPLSPLPPPLPPLTPPPAQAGLSPLSLRRLASHPSPCTDWPLTPLNPLTPLPSLTPLTRLTPLAPCPLDTSDAAVAITRVYVFVGSLNSTMNTAQRDRADLPANHAVRPRRHKHTTATPNNNTQT